MAATARPSSRARPAPKADAPKDAADDGEIEGTVVGTAGPDVLRIETVPRKAGTRVIIFYLDGAPYSVPEKPPAMVTLNYADALRKFGPVAGISYLLEVMLGTEGYDVLRGRDDITEEQIGQVISKITAQLGEVPKA